MNKAAFVVMGVVLLTGSHAFAQTHYMLCFGGGRAGLYYSDVFATPAATKSKDVEKLFDAFVKTKYGVMIHSECHSDTTQALAVADKKLRESSDQESKFPSKIIETGWTGK